MAAIIKKDSLDFLTDLSKNNNREWFNTHTAPAIESAPRLHIERQWQHAEFLVELADAVQQPLQALIELKQPFRVQMQDRLG